jgi:hypothetical protein
MREWTPARKDTYIVGLSQGRTAGLGHPNMTELSFLNKFRECPNRFLDWNTGINSSTLEQVQFFCPFEVFVDTVNAVPHTPFAAAASPFNGQESFICVFRVLLVECSKQLQVGRRAIVSVEVAYRLSERQIGEASK